MLSICIILRFYKRSDMNRDDDGAVDCIIGQDFYHCRNYNECNVRFIKRHHDDNADNGYQSSNGLN